MIKIVLLNEEALKTFKEWVKDKSLAEGSYYVKFIEETKVQEQLVSGDDLNG